MRNPIALLFAVALGVGGLHAPAWAANCDAQYFADWSACDGDSICQDNAAAVYVACLGSESEEAPPDCDRPGSCNPE